MTIAQGMRQSTARVFLDPARRRSNLRIETNALATRIVFDGRKAIAVRFEQAGQIKACDGPWRSDRELRRRRIGAASSAFGRRPASLLRDNAVAVVARYLAAVGRNLQDHACYDHYYRSSVPTMNEQLRPLFGKALAAFRYALLRDGPLANTMNHAGGFFASDTAQDRPICSSISSARRAMSARRPRHGG